MLEMDCPCCSYPLLRHIRAAEVYWYCSHCHQEMPANQLKLREINRSINTTSLESFEAWISYKKPRNLAFGLSST